MADWYYTVGTDRMGPVRGSQLKQLAADGTLVPDALVWTDGAADWVPARTVKGLFPAEAAVAVAAPMLTPILTPIESATSGAPAPAGGSLLQYASAGLVDGTVAPAPFAPPPADVGPFYKLGGQFTVAKQRWLGKAIVSPQAIYLYKVSRPSGYAYGVGGLIGAAIAAARADDMTRSCDLTELPDEVRVQFDPKFKKKKGDIVILSRDSLSLVKTSGWQSLLTAHCGSEKFPITTGLFRMGGVRRFMREHGWTLDFAIQPTAAPTHGRGYGLDDQTVRDRKRKGAWRRWGALVAIVLFILMIVVVQVVAHLH